MTMSRATMLEKYPTFEAQLYEVLIDREKGFEGHKSQGWSVPIGYPEYPNYTAYIDEANYAVMLHGNPGFVPGEESSLPEGVTRWPTGMVIAWFGGHGVHGMTARSYYAWQKRGESGDVCFWNTGSFADNEASYEDVRNSIFEHCMIGYFPY